MALSLGLGAGLLAGCGSTDPDGSGGAGSGTGTGTDSGQEARPQCVVATCCTDVDCGPGTCCSGGSCEPCCKSDSDCLAGRAERRQGILPKPAGTVTRRHLAYPYEPLPELPQLNELS